MAMEQYHATADERSEEQPDERIVELLHVITEEIYAVASDIVRLGEQLSADIEDVEKGGRISDMQAFDLIGQNTLAQARLLQEIGRRLAADDRQGIATLVALIEAVPFHRSRQRLGAVLTGAERGNATQEDAADEEDTDWF